ncbi:MAG: TlpA family protein disulfide reductase [Burkholderiaceae bacterium]|nr:TlpA family protein disulfide reductase [Burkholderiaceae bacterium]
MSIKKNLAATVFVALGFGALGAYFGLDKKPQPPVSPAAQPAATPAAAGPVQTLFAQTLPDAAGKQQALAQWRGKALLVNFWAPWCAPCVQEMPELSALQQEFAGKALQIIGVGIDSPGNIAQFAAKFKIAYPLYVAGMGGTDLMRLFDNSAGSLPYTVLIGADGQIKKTYLGRLQFERLRADLKSM